MKARETDLDILGARNGVYFKNGTHVQEQVVDELFDFFDGLLLRIFCKGLQPLINMKDIVRNMITGKIWLIKHMRNELGKSLRSKGLSFSMFLNSPRPME